MYTGKHGDDNKMIICAAVKYGDEIIRCHRHCHGLMVIARREACRLGVSEKEVIDHSDYKRPKGTDQGFLTSECKFVDRKEAYRIAEECGQLRKDIHPESAELTRGILLSEDIY